MKRYLCAALLCASLSAHPQAQFLTGEELAAEVAKNCDSGCIVFSPQEIAALEAAVAALVQARAEAAYEAGKDAANQSCRNRI
jgi:hypothetical protein